MILAVAGSTRGLEPDQRDTLIRWFIKYRTRLMAVHHLDRHGTDVTVVGMALALHIPCIGHPTTVRVHRAFIEGSVFWPVQILSERNRTLIRLCTRLLVLPDPSTSRPRAMHWRLYRLATAAKRPTTIIWPDGQMTKTASRYLHVGRLLTRTGAPVPWSRR